MAAYDLTPTLSKFFDRHLIIPLLEFLGGRQLYDMNDIGKAKIKVLQDTKMFDYLLQEYASLTDGTSPPPEIQQKREDVMEDFARISEQKQEILEYFQIPAVQKLIEDVPDSNVLYDQLCKEHNFGSDMLDKIYDWAKFNFETGNYQEATQFLDLFRSVAPTSHSKQRSARWGKAAGEVLLQEWNTALEDLQQLKTDIDSSANPTEMDRNPVPIAELLTERAWLIHWSLYVFFNHPQGKDKIVEWCLGSADYLNAIQTLCPHILRYLVVAILTNKNKRRQHLKEVKDVIEVIKQESSNYSDPVTEFVISVFVEFDFEKSQKKLQECEIVLENDFFLVGCVHDFIDSARKYIFETYCRINSRISIASIAETLNLGVDDAEKWIANVIREARLDAKIDAAKGEVLMGTPALSSYQMLIEKTKNLALRTQQMVNAVEKKAGPRPAPYQEMSVNY